MASHRPLPPSGVSVEKQQMLGRHPDPSPSAELPGLRAWERDGKLERPTFPRQARDRRAPARVYKCRPAYLPRHIPTHVQLGYAHTQPCCSNIPIQSTCDLPMPDTAMDTHYAFQPTTTSDNDVTTSLMGDKVVMKSSEYRKVIKPLLEKRRRARINQCLTELKALLLDVHKADITEPSKLEKADILELTVRHLRDLRRQQRVLPTPYSGASDKFRAGFTECANEVSACLANLPGVDGAIKSRLISHLGKCIDRVRIVRSQPAPQQHQIPQQEVYTHQVMPQTELYTSHTHQHHHHHPSHAQAVLSSPTPPPSPVGRVSPYPVEMESEKTERFHSTALPTGYASLAVLMSHKRLTDSGIPSPATSPAPISPVPQSNSVWRPW